MWQLLTQVVQITALAAPDFEQICPMPREERRYTLCKTSLFFRYVRIVQAVVKTLDVDISMEHLLEFVKFVGISYFQVSTPL
jgi:hypothetical protein